ncbi:hypothetical protein GCM10007416_05040 [Kroppenstedtia guangzhouensis]|uniref:Uncharacterized protein n=1 Tax=Kroppenstedtia guangzhouensis TaxID=1274356 RepID=A0ABQ1G226_9BACL|nr:hypothetical protein GCM10007416_05040 [Kroppenstedtia guangzhouensis]
MEVIILLMMISLTKFGLTSDGATKINVMNDLTRTKEDPVLLALGSMVRLKVIVTNSIRAG